MAQEFKFSWNSNRVLFSIYITVKNTSCNLQDILNYSDIHYENMGIHYPKMYYNLAKELKELITTEFKNNIPDEPTLSMCGDLMKNNMIAHIVKNNADKVTQYIEFKRSNIKEELENKIIRITYEGKFIHNPPTEDTYSRILYAVICVIKNNQELPFVNLGECIDDIIECQAKGIIYTLRTKINPPS